MMGTQLVETKLFWNMSGGRAAFLVLWQSGIFSRGHDIQRWVAFDSIYQKRPQAGRAQWEMKNPRTVALAYVGQHIGSFILHLEKVRHTTKHIPVLSVCRGVSQRPSISKYPNNGPWFCLASSQCILPSDPPATPENLPQAGHCTKPRDSAA